MSPGHHAKIKIPMSKFYLKNTSGWTLKLEARSSFRIELTHTLISDSWIAFYSGGFSILKIRDPKFVYDLGTYSVVQYPHCWIVIDTESQLIYKVDSEPIIRTGSREFVFLSDRYCHMECSMPPGVFAFATKDIFSNEMIACEPEKMSIKLGYRNPLTFFSYETW